MNDERVIRSSYEVTIDGFSKHPGAKYVLEKHLDRRGRKGLRPKCISL
ncbi:hypothetical protein GX586_06615 [bacterium]|nr:hypothetical protein [bacterium]